MRKLLTLVIAVIAITGIVIAAALWLGWKDVHDPYKGYSGAEQFVTIRQGASPGEIGRALADAQVVTDTRAFRVALWWTGRARNLKAGEYRFARPMTPLEVVDMIARGQVYTQRITFPEGLTIEDMARMYEARGFGRADDFVAATRSVDRIRGLDPDARDLEGYLFPETYSLGRREPAALLVGLMVDRFLRVFGEDMRARAASEGMTVRQVVTLASLVEKETARPEERPIVAAVYRNRLRIGMPMQADPTIVYALQKARRYNGNIRKDDLAMNSPYNTYKYPGLPPGPIASPGKASLEAAATPADVPYLYFVSRNDGSHVFAETFAEHAANVRKFQVEYFRNQRRSSVPPTSTSRGGARSSRVPAPSPGGGSARPSSRE